MAKRTHSTVGSKGVTRAASMVAPPEARLNTWQKEVKFDTVPLVRRLHLPVYL